LFVDEFEREADFFVLDVLLWKISQIAERLERLRLGKPNVVRYCDNQQMREAFKHI